MLLGGHSETLRPLYFYMIAMVSIKPGLRSEHEPYAIWTIQTNFLPASHILRDGHESKAVLLSHSAFEYRIPHRTICNGMKISLRVCA